MNNQTEAISLNKPSILRSFLPALCAAPAAAVGSAVMGMQGASAAKAMMNPAVLVVCGLLAFLSLNAKKRAKGAALYACMAAGLLAMCAAFLFPGAEGVHRWVYVGPLALHAALIALPIMLIGLYALPDEGKDHAALTLCAAVCVILFLQKDASMLTAFALATLPMMAKSRAAKPVRFGVMGLQAVLALVSWAVHPMLEPAAHVEGILALAFDCGPVWGVLGVAAMALLFGPFAPAAKAHPRRAFLAGGALFYAGWLLSCALGSFPVPVMGYGASAVIGYVILAAAAVKN